MLSVLYRGPLSSCNFGCAYCPFAKKHESDEAHAADGRALERFLAWCEGYRKPLRVFFTPWGEALTQRRYQEALARLTHLGHVQKAAVQTNLSARLDWLDTCEARKLGIWATYHPEWVTRPRFLAQCGELRAREVSFSVGVVGFPSVKDELLALREALPPDIYVWVNAVKSLADTYSADDLAFFTRIDPLFPLNLKAHPSKGRSCRGGETVISVDGEGTVRSCHFLREPLGNLYAPDFERALRARPCSAETCGCHIGYVHLEDLGLEPVFGDGILERVPTVVPSPRWGEG
jgi:MoaA/NifB/PqqE/SkfB family radical SAM enzyme